MMRSSRRPFEPYLGGVDDVLEDGVGGQQYGRYGVEILKGQPHGQDDVLLRQRLPSRDAAVEAGTDGFAEDEVGCADGDPGKGKEDFEPVILFAGLQELFKGARHKDDEHPRPQVIAKMPQRSSTALALGAAYWDEPRAAGARAWWAPRA